MFVCVCWCLCVCPLPKVFFFRKGLLQWPLNYVFTLIVALHSFRLKLCFVKCIAPTALGKGLSPGEWFSIVKLNINIVIVIFLSLGISSCCICVSSSFLPRGFHPVPCNLCFVKHRRLIIAGGWLLACNIVLCTLYNVQHTKNCTL